MDAMLSIAIQHQAELRAEATRQRLARPNPLRFMVSGLLALITRLR